MTSLASERNGGLSVSRETISALRAFESEVRRWNPTVNLVSRSSIDHLWDRHILDSAQIFQACPKEADHWLDLGSGGGFPGAVIAILARELLPHLRITLVESDQRKAAFLRQTVQRLGLSASVEATRVEALVPQAADVVSARALAPLSVLLDLAEPHLKPEGTCLFPKGIRHADEVLDAQRSWRFDLDAFPSALHPGAAILIIRKLERAQLP